MTPILVIVSAVIGLPLMAMAAAALAIDQDPVPALIAGSVVSGLAAGLVQPARAQIALFVATVLLIALAFLIGPEARAFLAAAL